MKDYNGKLLYKDKEYPMVFNLNVMELIQEKYGSVEHWGELTDGAGAEVDIKALLFGLTEMINEGIDIQNEDAEEKMKPVTKKFVGRMITEIGIENATDTIHETVIESTQSAEKNA